MSRHELPAWLVHALPAAQRAAVAGHEGAVRAGDVCRLAVAATPEQPAEGRLVVVLGVDPNARLASVMLTHADFDIRTSLDVLVTGDELGMPFALAIQTDLVGPVGVGSLTGTMLGRVDDQLLEDLRDAVDTGEIPSSLAGRVGMPLRGPEDARWEWKVAEGAVLDGILAAHTATTAEAVSPVHALANAFREIGTCGDRQDDLGTVTDCLLAYMARRQAPPTPVLTLLAQPPTAAALGNDMMRAIGPLLRVA